MPFGAPGGDSQVQAMLQVALNIFHFGMVIQKAIDAPRFISLSFPSLFAPYSHYPGRMALEDRFEPGVTDALKELGHEIEMLPADSRRFASVEAILHQPKTTRVRHNDRAAGHAARRIAGRDDPGGFRSFSNRSGEPRSLAACSRPHILI